MINSSRCDFLAVYGTLRRRSIFPKLPEAVPQLYFVGYGQIRGRLFWQHTFPALTQGPGIVGVELFEILDAKVWCHLDSYEGFDPANSRASLFIRRQVLLTTPRRRAWVYFLNRDIPLGRVTEQGAQCIRPEGHSSEFRSTKLNPPAFAGARNHNPNRTDSFELWRGPDSRRRTIPLGTRDIWSIRSIAS
jgi:gamma-glutamylcyclotransferase (GGCT)/AIG2-like uncharacterized protein YtfP